MNKLVTILFTIGLVLVTSLVLVAKPDLHRQIMVVDSNFTFVDEVKDVAIRPKATSTPKIVKKTETSKKVQPKQTQPKVVKKTEKVVKTQPVQKMPKNEDVKKKETEVQVPIKTEKLPEKVVPESKIVIEQEEPVKEVELPVNTIKQLTEQEEIIAWNKWRSDLQNQVMKDTQIAAPLGVEFKFSFTVDKFGNMSNIKVWSTSSAYSDLAVQRIKPVLMSYQGKPILNFPVGTKRVITNVGGGFVMATSTGYSSPSDYSDYERIIR